MEHISKILFMAGVAIFVYGLIDKGIVAYGAMSMNTASLNAIALFAASGAAELMWGKRSAS